MTSTERRTVSHPAWCAPSRCDDNGTDLVHAGPVDVIVGTDGPLSVALVQCDDHEQSGPAEARLTVGDGRVHLDLAGVRALRAWCDATEQRM